MAKVKLLLLISFMSIYLVGCASLFLMGTGAGFGVATHKYLKGSLTVIYEAPYMKTWDATLKAMDNMNFKIRTQKHNLTAGKIEAKRSDDEWVGIIIEYKSSQETEVVIRVGLFGDEKASMVIKEEIRKVLIEG